MSTPKQTLFSDLSSTAKISLAAGVVLILALAAGLYWWSVQTQYQVVLQNAQKEDIARAEQELSTHQIPFQITEDGLSLSVADQYASQARIILADLGLPFDNTVGLEMFATSDFGVTEFAQQINYKRALEGELTRTISAMHEVRYARVHLVLPEKGLLKSDHIPSSAAVTLFLRNGVSLSTDQVTGIQRLVVASVPGMKADHVTILDQQGNTLSHDSNDSPAVKIDNEQADLEARLQQKVADILLQQFSAQAFKVTVNAEIERHATHRVEERPVIGADGKGALTRKISSTEYPNKSSKPTQHSEESYEYGLIREETDIPGGSLSRLSVAVWLSADLSAEQKNDLEALIQIAVGADPQRGDRVALMVSAPVAVEPAPAATSELPAMDMTGSDSSPVPTAVKTTTQPDFYIPIGGITVNALYIVAGLLGLLIICILIVIKLMWDMRKMRLTRQQREVLLNQLNQILYEQKREQV
ncbi:flagellar basal-body MS-ring/collar protein FliF [Gynuella sp.]|uniref:flagellar basal-body MS-ring/collar protein FliF n=1 Tax=Gynuella sp. TaxID=2969146 RepID=UPI003D11F76E